MNTLRQYRDGGWKVINEQGRCISRKYATQDEAQRRLEQLVDLERLKRANRARKRAEAAT